MIIIIIVSRSVSCILISQFAALRMHGSLCPAFHIVVIVSFACAECHTCDESHNASGFRFKIGLLNTATSIMCYRYNSSRH